MRPGRAVKKTSTANGTGSARVASASIRPPDVSTAAPTRRLPDGISAKDLAFAEGRIGDIRRREVIGWAAAGQGLVFGSVGSILGLAEVYWYIAVPPGIVGLDSLAVTGCGLRVEREVDGLGLGHTLLVLAESPG